MTKWDTRFAFFPTTLVDGSRVWLEHFEEIVDVILVPDRKSRLTATTRVYRQPIVSGRLRRLKPTRIQRDIFFQK